MATPYTLAMSKSSISCLTTPELDHKKGQQRLNACWTPTDFLRSRLDRFVFLFSYIKKAKRWAVMNGRYFVLPFCDTRFVISLRGQYYPKDLVIVICLSLQSGISSMVLRQLENSARQLRIKGSMAANFAMAAQKLDCHFLVSPSLQITQKARPVVWLETNRWLWIKLPPNANRLLAAQKCFIFEGKEIEVRGGQHQRKVDIRVLSLGFCR